MGRLEDWRLKARKPTVGATHPPEPGVASTHPHLRGTLSGLVESHGDSWQPHESRQPHGEEVRKGSPQPAKFTRARNAGSVDTSTAGLVFFIL